MKKLPFDSEEVEMYSRSYDWIYWVLIILAGVYFVGRILVTIIWKV